MIKYLDQLQNVIDKYDISRDDICICGSSILSIFNLKLNNDLDIIIRPQARKILIRKYEKELNILLSGAICYNENIQSSLSRYEIVGVSDNEIINSSKYYFLYNGWKCARIELEIAAKIKKKREKDIEDIKRAEEFLSNYTDFDWTLFCKCISINKSYQKRLMDFLIKGIKTFSSHPKIIFRKFINFVQECRGVLCCSLSISTDTELAAITDFMVSPATLLGMQFKGNSFNRYDIIMRYLSIKKMDMNPNDSLNEYRMMQKERVNNNTEEDFRMLISNIVNNGFSTKYPLSIDLNANLIDGSHRLACSLYYNIEQIPYSVIRSKSDIHYELDWFRKYSFDSSVLTELEETKKKLFLFKGIYFCAIIWGAAKGFYNDISNDIGKQCKIVYQENLFLDDNYGDFIDDIYAIDDIERWKVITKKQLLYQFSHEIKFILFEFPTPNFRIKKRNHSYLSSKGATLKNMLRKKYHSRISNYFYDIIVHIGDNYDHNAEIIKNIQKYTTINIDKIDID